KEGLNNATLANFGWIFNIGNCGRHLIEISNGNIFSNNIPNNSELLKPVYEILMKFAGLSAPILKSTQIIF
ncbi:MAG: hypothetical protein RBS55_08565, partial [Bacteroidales bacterium]|nr:hypothetical protein [Bacteroidales bacterium]